MTTGQRIAQKRKEAGLSQETLGAELGVSRQSIYKWESDTALPEIDKLVALSRRFGVTVGWLLGVEEAPETASAPDSGELTDAQLKMVEEITARYIAALPAPKPRKKWPYVLAALMVLCMPPTAPIRALTGSLTAFTAGLVRWIAVCPIRYTASPVRWRRSSNSRTA